MSKVITKSWKGHHECKREHELCWHVYRDFHNAEDTMMVTFHCSSCYSKTAILMDKHLAEQLAEILEGTLQ